MIYLFVPEMENCYQMTVFGEANNSIINSDLATNDGIYIHRFDPGDTGYFGAEFRINNIITSSNFTTIQMPRNYIPDEIPDCSNETYFGVFKPLLWLHS